MIEISSKDRCCGCYACANGCPNECIKMVSDEEGFWYPKIDKNECIDCGLCEIVCPIINKWQPINDNRPIEALAAINKNEEIRINSSSGGIFTLIAEAIINQKGVVFGAAFSDNFRYVNHIAVKNISELERLRGSKYVQSGIGYTYKRVKEHLENGKKVLFTGTPCQIGGLYSFLRKSYDNLYTQDIICHGVPSPMVWDKYVEELEGKFSSKIKRMCFRSKRSGWKSYSSVFAFSNNKEYKKNYHEDPYMKAFLSNLCLRNSCYNCQFKGITRQADITLADFWGIQYILPEMDDDKGASLVLVNSEKGKYIFEMIRSCVECKCVDLDTVVKYNNAMTQSVEEPLHRKEFMDAVRITSFDKLEKKYLRKPIFCIVKNRFKRLVNIILKCIKS